MSWDILCIKRGVFTLYSQPRMMNKVACLAVIVVALQVWTVQSGDAIINQACSSTSDCVENQGLECRKEYPSCSKAKCLCPDSQEYLDSVCKTKRYIGDSCGGSVEVVAARFATCSDNQTQCASGSSAAGKALCKSTTYPVLGEACTIYCYYYTDTTYGSGSCSGGTCVCRSGMKRSGTNCVNKVPGDSCSSTGSTDGCPTGQNCVESSCACDTDYYTSYQGGCTRKGSVIEGNRCVSGSSDSNERCEAGLECGTCPEDAQTRCLRSSASFSVPATLNLIAGICLGVVGKKIMF